MQSSTRELDRRGNGTNYKRLIRLNSDGSPDNTFEIGVRFNASVNTVIIQLIKILVGGDFTCFNGNSQCNKFEYVPYLV
jgi:hypothetical protein